MIKNLHLKTMLLLCAMVMGIGSAWAQEVTIASFSNAANEGWTINNAEYATAGGGYYKLTSSDASIVTPSINWTEYTDITIIISARKFGGPDTTQGKIAVSQGEVELATYSPSGTSIAASSALSISPTDGVITISCPGASSNKGCGVQSIVIKAKDPSGGDIQTVATPTFSPAGGTYAEVKNVTISTETENATIYYTTNGTDPTISSNVYSSAISVSKTTTIKAMAVKEGMNNSGVATATYTINLPYSGDGYVRINSLSDLTDGAKVIIAARYNETADAYYAMTAAAKGKPAGVAFTSTTTSKGEELPSTILDNESTYYWTVGVTSDGYTFTNSNNKILGYSEKTDFAEGGNNTKWTITRETSGSSALVSGYEGFYIINKNNKGRGVALSSNGQYYGSFATSNNNSNVYNFYLDFFVEGATPVFVPSISANNVNIAYDATEGSIAYTLNNSVEGGVVTASTEAEWLTLGTVGETIPFTCTANTETTERTATVTLTYTYGDNETITKDVTVTQTAAPVVYTTIPAIFAAATSTATDVNVTFGNWVVSGVSTNGKNVFVTDGTNGFVIFDTNGGLNNTYAVGDILSGTAVSCKLVLYNGFAEITNLDATDLTITSGGTVSAASIAMADLAGVNTGALVSYENLTCSVSDGKYYLSDGTTTLQVYNTLYAFEALKNGKTYNITGIYQQFNNTKEILPRSADDIEEVVSTEPSITVDPAVVNVNADEHDGTLDLTYENLPVTSMEDFGIQYYDAEGEEVGEPDWIEVLVAEQDPQVGEGYVVSYYMFENEGDARTASFKVYALDDEANEVYSNLITITQAKYVETTTYTLATSITSGKHYVIASGTDGEVYAMGKMKSTNREAVAVTATSGTIALSGEEGAYEFVIAGPDANGNYTIYDESTTSTGYLYAAGGTGSNHLKVQENKDANAEWSISFGTNGVATIKAKMNGSTNDRNWMRFNNGSSKLFSCYASGQQDVYLYEKDGEDAPTETVHVSDAKYATYCSENALDFDGTGLTAYIAKMNGSEVSFEEVTSVPAYTGVLLKANAAGDFTVNVATTVDDVTGNAFIGVTEETSEEAGIFVLMNTTEYGVGFYKAENAFTVGAHTAYLPALPSASRNFIAIDEATAIKTIETAKMSSEIYNLAGQRVKSAQKGLYIIDGKKVVIK